MNPEGVNAMREDIERFIRRVDELEETERIALKRCCGRLLENADAGAMKAFYRALAGTGGSVRTKERLFPAACMRCMWDKEEIKETAVAFENALSRRRRDSGGWPGTERRLVKLLDQRWDPDGILCVDLWRMVKQMKRGGCVIDMVSLGMDLCLWNAESRQVQKRWLQACYSAEREEKNNAD